MSKKMNDVIIKAIYGMICAIVISQTMGLSSISSICFAAVMALTVCLWISYTWKRIGKVSLLAVMISLTALINVLINAVLNHRIFELSYLIKLISFVLALLYFGIMCENRVGKKTAEFVMHMNTALALYLVGIYILDNSRMHLMNGIVWHYLTFQFHNPNQTAAFLLCTCMLESIQVFRKITRPEKLLHMVLTAVLTGFVYETGSRNCMLALLSFLAFYLYGLLRPDSSLKMPRWMAAGFAIFPWIFSLAYMSMINNRFLQRIFGFLVDSGKSLSSRTIIWNRAYSGFMESPMIGAFTQLLYSSGQFHMHNSHVDTLASYGLPVFILYLVFLYMALSGASGNRAAGRVNQIACWAFATVLLVGMGEATFFSGGLGIYAYAGAFLMIVNVDFEGESV